MELAIRKLPDAQRVPLVLFHFQDMSYEEIAAKLHVSLAKVKSDIHRGRENFEKTCYEMSDPNKDWLEEELENLRDLEAPATLLPG